MPLGKCKGLVLKSPVQLSPVLDLPEDRKDLASAFDAAVDVKEGTLYPEVTKKRMQTLATLREHMAAHPVLILLDTVDLHREYGVDDLIDLARLQSVLLVGPGKLAGYRGAQNLIICSQTVLRHFC
jgi:hypothetical protein